MRLVYDFTMGCTQHSEQQQEFRRLSPDFQLHNAEQLTIGSEFTELFPPQNLSIMTPHAKYLTNRR